MHRIPSLIEKKIQDLDKFYDKLNSDLVSIGLDYQQTDKVVKVMKEIISEHKNSIEYLIKNTTTSPEKIVGDVLGHSYDRLQLIDSKYKR